MIMNKTCTCHLFKDIADFRCKACVKVMLHNVALGVAQ